MDCQSHQANRRHLEEHPVHTAHAATNTPEDAESPAQPLKRKRGPKAGRKAALASAPNRMGPADWPPADPYAFHCEPAGATFAPASSPAARQQIHRHESPAQPAAPQRHLSQAGACPQHRREPQFGNEHRFHGQPASAPLTKPQSSACAQDERSKGPHLPHMIAHTLHQQPASSAQVRPPHAMQQQPQQHLQEQPYYQQQQQQTEYSSSSHSSADHHIYQPQQLQLEHSIHNQGQQPARFGPARQPRPPQVSHMSQRLGGSGFVHGQQQQHLHEQVPPPQLPYHHQAAGYEQPPAAGSYLASEQAHQAPAPQQPALRPQQRLSPYANQQVQMAPMQPQVRQVPLGQQQYKPRLSQPLVAPGNYQAPFLDAEQQYPAGSPTLLQQQLNRTPQPPPAQHQRLAGPPQQAQVPRYKPQARAPAPARYELADPTAPYEMPARMAPCPTRPEQAFYPRGPTPARSQRAPEPQTPHLLGNPTPPLTPNSARGPADSQWQPHLHGPMGDHHQHHVQQQPQQAPPPQPPVAYGNPVAGGLPVQQQSHALHQAAGEQSLVSAPLQQRSMMPKNTFQGQQPHFQGHSHHAPTSQVPARSLNQQQHHNHQMDSAAPTRNQIPTQQQQQQQQQPLGNILDLPPSQTRLTLPLRDAPLLGPFRLDHEAQYTSKVFHIKAQLFDTLSKSMNLMNVQTATVIQELQFRAYLIKQEPQGNSLLASNSQPVRPCTWPDLFQVSVNQNVIHLDRSKSGHKAADIFQFCQFGDNVLDIQVNDCYCTHEFVLEAVDRPTLKAFMNSCFKSRLLPVEGCIQKMKFNFGAPGFLVQGQHLLQSAGIFNEYVAEFVQGVEQTKTRISLKCPISGRRMRTPTRGHNCKHLQCFDLENFLFSNRERSQWSCPICALSIPFNMLELDQHQINMIQTMAEILNTDEVLVDGAGQWRAFFPQPQQPQSMPAAPQQQQVAPPASVMHNTAKSTGTYHPQSPALMNGGSPISSQPMRPMSGPGMGLAGRGPMAGSPAWDSHAHHEPARGPSASLGTGRRSANGSPLAKKPYAGQYAQGPPPAQTSSSYFAGEQQAAPTFGESAGGSDELHPLAAMERITHEQQMGPPPFDPNSLTASPAAPLRAIGGGNSLISPGQQPGSSGAGSIPPPHASPDSRANSANYSPATHAVASPLARMVPASPQQQPRPGPPSDLPLSPLQQQQQQQQQQAQANTSISTPATPSSSMLLHGGPDTPATPGNQPAGSSMGMSHSPHVAPTGQQQQSAVDHQPLSNGSASAGSITSSSTMTPSGQSLGSVGMGGDSRCGTAPLQGTGSLGLDDLMLPGCSVNHSAQSSAQLNKQSLQSANSPHIDEKNDILMGKLMMDSNESILRDHPNGELALALEEAEWKQQLDRGKSEHLANFLNEPMMSKQHHHHNNQLFQQTSNSSKMLSGGLNPSDDEANQSQGSSPAQNIDQLDYANYLDADTADNGAGLPPDDSILDLFER